MSNLFGIASSGLLAFQKGMAVTGHNIANATTEGYSRQEISFDSAPGQRLGKYVLGNGVTAGTNKRAYDDFLTNEVRTTGASLNQFETMENLSGRLVQLLSNQEDNLTSQTDRFFLALDDLTSNPLSIPSRQVVISEGEYLATQFRNLDAQLAQLDDLVDTELTNLTTEINSQLNTIAQINATIADTNGEVSPDLLDQRDLEVRTLSEKLGVRLAYQDSGVVNLSLYNGLPLITGNSVATLSIAVDEFDASQARVELSFPGNGPHDITNAAGNGTLQGLIGFRDGLLHDTRQQIGLMALGLTTSFNDQHTKGLDMNGNLGSNFFAANSIPVLPSLNNTGNASITASVSDLSAVTAGDLDLSFDGTNWLLANPTSGQSVTGTGSITLNGITVTLDNLNASNGDSFKIRPTFSAASQVSLAATDPALLATRGPLVPSASATNTGNSDISDISITDTSLLPVAADVTLTYSANALGAGQPGFTVNGGAQPAVAYDPGADSAGKQISLVGIAGATITIAGAPAEGDTLTLSNNVNGVGDNRNLMSLTDLPRSKSLLSGTTSYTDLYSSTVASAGIQSRQAEVSAETHRSLHDHAVSNQQEKVGVNLDEEAAKLLQYQQAYQAAARVIAVSDEMFQTLMGAFRR